ncbi:MAG: hypothetical protein A2889_02475 [Nitrospinae bacterium RIFCSPLOWO2_01_FULL_39_10]|nr:MAG: hypothetical protein A2889_02475 [Nitrospinae bacterium RIFCSPLOWO2_01_FULL_39_10]
MKCPKCGYVSFEYLDTCRKCGRDLTQLKTDMGVTTFTPGVINVLKYVEGMEEAVEEGEESAVATATAEETEEAGAAAVVEAVAVTSEEQSAKVETQEKGEIEISLPEDITEPKLDVAEVSPQPMAEEKKGEIEFSLEPAEEKKEEISLTIEEEPKIEETLSVEPEIKESPVEEITLSLEDIAELGGEKDKGKKKEGDEIKLEIE